MIVRGRRDCLLQMIRKWRNSLFDEKLGKRDPKEADHP